MFNLYVRPEQNSNKGSHLMYPEGEKIFTFDATSPSLRIPDEILKCDQYWLVILLVVLGKGHVMMAVITNV